MMPTLTVNTTQEFQELVNSKDFRISKAIVSGILDNIKSTKSHIHVLSVNCLEDNEIYDVTVERKYFIETLEENLPHYELEEQYEDCQRIVDTIKSLKTAPVKKKGRPKKV